MERLVSSYFLIQAVSIALWWIGICWIPGFVNWFHPSDWPSESILAFSLADGCLLVVSIVAAVSVWRKVSWKAPVVWVVAGSASYATLYCLGVALITNQTWISVALMGAMMGVNWVAVTLVASPSPSSRFIVEARMSAVQATVTTLTQATIFWCLFLWWIPFGVVEFENRLGLEIGLGLEAGWTKVVAVVLFVLASSLGVASAIWMANQGLGTPLPSATAPRLVIGGPYRWVRNPMAVAGIVQGVSVGIWLGSWLVVGYALLGSLLWHRWVRPVEEADLLKRFGSDYLAYQERVPLWLPKTRGIWGNTDRH